MRRVRNRACANWSAQHRETRCWPGCWSRRRIPRTIARSVPSRRLRMPSPMWAWRRRARSWWLQPCNPGSLASATGIYGTTPWIVAQVAEYLARRSTVRTDPSEAFLAGLVHDVGCLAFATMPPKFLERFPAPYRPWMPAGASGNVPGGTVPWRGWGRNSEVWKFPHPFVEAVRWATIGRSVPQDRLASLCNLGEYWSDSDEDLSSCVRLRTALERAGVSEQTLAELGR